MDRREYSSEYRKTHKAQINETAKRYRAGRERLVAEYANEYRSKNIDKIRARDKVRRTSIRSRLFAVRARARQKGLDFQLTEEWVKSIPMKCYYTGMDLTMEPHLPNTISFERVDNNKGYTLENTVLCSNVVNIMKKAMSKEQFIDICHRISRTHPSSMRLRIEEFGRNNPELLG